jgi:hypothetical protein
VILNDFIPEMPEPFFIHILIVSPPHFSFKSLSICVHPDWHSYLGSISKIPSIDDGVDDVDDGVDDVDDGVDDVDDGVDDVDDGVDDVDDGVDDVDDGVDDVDDGVDDDSFDNVDDDVELELTK